MNSVNLQSSTSHCELESLVSQDPTWTSKTAVAANGLFHSALHMNIDVDTSSASSVNSHDMELPGDLGSLSFSSSIMYARGFMGQNDIRSSNSNIFLDDSSLRETIYQGGFSIPDFATSMFPVISRMFPRAVASPRLVILGNNSTFESALRNMAGPSTLQLVRQQSMDHQIIYMIFHRLINDSDAFQVLDEPKTELDQVFKTGISYCFSLGNRVLRGLIDSTPSPYDLALMQNIFRAALVLSNERILSYVLDMHQASLANQPFFIGDFEYYPLEYAASKGHIKATKALLEHGADPNRQTSDYGYLNRILGIPWEQKDRQVGVQILRLLIDHGLESNPRELRRRIGVASRDELSILVTHCLDKSFPTFFHCYGLTLLLLEREWEDPLSKTLEVILNQAFLQIDGQKAIWDSVLSISLSAAILLSRASAVNVLLSMGAAPDTHCLISAAQVNDVQLLKEFLSRGLDPNVKVPVVSHNYEVPHANMWRRDSDSTALSESIVKRSSGAFLVLHERGFVSSLSHQPTAFATAFVAACQVGDSILLDELLSLPNFPRRQEKLGQAIQGAINGDQYHIIEKLLSVGMKPNIESLDLAIQKRKLPTVILLARYMGNSLSRGMQQGIHKTTALFQAIRWGDQTASEHVLKIGHPVNVCDVMRGDGLKDWDLLPEVLALAPNLDGLWRYTPLSAAILTRNSTAVKALMAYGVQSVLFSAHHTSQEHVSTQHPAYEREVWILTPLAAAVVVNDLHLIREILRMGADPFDNSALFSCAMVDCRDEVIALLLSAFRTRYPDGARSFGSDALYQTVRRGNMQLLQLLAKDVDLIGRVEKYREPIDRRSVRLKDTAYTSPLAEAVRRYNDSDSAGAMLDHLLPLVRNHDAVIHKSYKHGVMTPLLYAISLGSLATVRKLHQTGANISLPAEWLIDRTPLQAASAAGSKDIVEYLLREGADPNEPPADHAGATAIQLAAITGKIGVATVLLDARADINAPPAFCDGRTAFEGATENGRIEMMIFLVSRGADLLSHGSIQYRRAVEFAEDNAQHAARKLADELYKQVLASQVTGSIDMGRDAWAGPDMGSYRDFLS
ncbi:hypothetical protein AA0111_g12256 [Alternaria arborescens]|uniref:hypothetical protein n=1 Tax=Alternaria arborescens TaxID=156630 RepID=UPI00107540D9|nr:hypothetical protein AA0111_g12256 [Alternaria arborescens]RYO13367.1 hypothetical protein AA0111_g12256 [Alternaria arborescens]